MLVAVTSRYVPRDIIIIIGQGRSGYLLSISSTKTSLVLDTSLFMDLKNLTIFSTKYSISTISTNRNIEKICHMAS